MTVTILDRAIEALRGLPADRQREVAAYVVELAAEAGRPEDIPQGDLEAVLAGIADAERGAFATDREVETAYRAFGE